MSPAVVCTPLRIEQVALRGIGLPVVHTGMGLRRAAATAAVLGDGPILVAGVAGALTRDVRPGDVVVATEIHPSAVPCASFPASIAPSPIPVAPSFTTGLCARLRRTLWWNSAQGELSSRVEIPSAPLLAGALRRLGLRVHLGSISSVPGIAWKPAAGDALAVDMESAALAVPGVPFAVVRAIVDTPKHPLWHPGTLARGVVALRALRACRPALELWAAATGPREVRLAAPRSSGADVAQAQAQVAVREIAREVDLVLVIGSPNSSDSVRLVEVAHRERVPAYLIDDVSQIDLRALAGTTRVGITAGSPHLVEEIIHCLGGLGSVCVTESRLIDEDVTFALPPRGG